MASFSERHGYKEARSVVQRERLDDSTRVALWNILAPLSKEFGKYRSDPTEKLILDRVWTRHLGRARDEMPFSFEVWKYLKTEIMIRDWNEVLDLLECIMRAWDKFQTRNTSPLKEIVLTALNGVFERELVAYRFIGLEITPIDSAIESDAVTTAIADVHSIEGARHAFERAVELLADRTSPDYPNSIKESISAVEAVIRKVTGETTLGTGLK